MGTTTEAPIEDGRDLFVYELRGLYYAERELVEALERLADEATIDALDYLQEKEKKRALGDLFDDHRTQTETHVERLEDVFDALGEEPEPREDPLAEGIVRDKDRFNNIVLNDELRCLYYVRTGATVERTEISSYEALLDLAEQLDLDDDVADPLEETLEEERQMLSEIESHRGPLAERAAGHRA